MSVKAGQATCFLAGCLLALLIIVASHASRYRNSELPSKRHEDEKWDCAACPAMKVPVETSKTVAPTTVAKAELLQPVQQCRAALRITSACIGLGRLGNNLFMYASTLAVSLRHNLTFTLVFQDEHPLWFTIMNSLFQLSAVSCAGIFDEDKRISEDGWGLYIPSVDNSTSFGNRTSLACYLQSFKYFHKYTSTIRTEFTLSKTYYRIAQGFLKRARGSSRTAITFVGVHVRRGDMWKDYSSLYNVASIGYIVRAMSYFQRKFARSTGVIFVVASDDVTWTSSVLSTYWNGSRVVYTRGSVRGDMAILSQCNHSVITSGTYGWWAGWLAGGKVVYYRNFVSNSSSLWSGYKAEDYYPPSWIGMS